MMCMRILVCFLAAQLAASARMKRGTQTKVKNDPTVSAVAQAIVSTEEVLGAAEEKAIESAETAVGVAEVAQGPPEMSPVKVNLEFGKKPAGTKSIKGTVSLAFDASVPKPTPVNGTLPSHLEIAFKTNTDAMAKKLVTNINSMLLKVLGEDMEGLHQELPKIVADGSIIKVSFDHSMEYKDDFDKIKAAMQVVSGVEVSEDIYLDMDGWVEKPTTKLMDAFAGMKYTASATVAKQILTQASQFFDLITSSNESTASVKGTLGEEKYVEIVQKVKEFLGGKEVAISFPDEVEKMKQELHKNPNASKSYDVTFDSIAPKLKEAEAGVAGEPHAVAALNFVQQAAAANLRLSGVSWSGYSGAVKLSWSLEGFPLFKMVAEIAEKSGADDVVYDGKEPEAFEIPGVGAQEVQKMEALEKESNAAPTPQPSGSKSGALATTCQGGVIAAIAAFLA